MAVLVVVLAVISAIIFAMKRRTQKRKSVVVDEWIRALEEKQAEAKATGAVPAEIEGVTLAPPEVTEEKPTQQPASGLDEDMLNQMRKGPYGSMHRAERIQRPVRFSVQANHGPR